MNLSTNLAESIEKTIYESKYDGESRYLVADKQVLARIVKENVCEFKAYDLDVIESCIEGEPQVSEVDVHPANAKTQKIKGMANESTIPGEGKVTFDIRFTIITPDKERLKIIINVETQKKYYVGYGFAPRGVFYCARMISEQLNTEFEADDYDQIKKVYSIWICMDAPEWAANTITAYEIKPRDVYGTFRGDEKYDLLSVIIIRLSKKENAESGNELIKMLTVLLSDTMDVETKKAKLQNEHGMRMTQKLERRLRSMCNLSEGILERGIEIGLERGQEIGKEIGVTLGEMRTKCQTVRNAYKYMSITDMVHILKYDADFVKKVVVLLAEYPNATDAELVELLQAENKNM